MEDLVGMVEGGILVRSCDFFGSLVRDEGVRSVSGMVGVLPSRDVYMTEGDSASL